mgnify:CR=1 FL=1|jgi:hypothetical protein|tara:strand:- start:10081 stop:10275 length:195 start_codon:yes stop_codon:yes gene_type:complete
MKYALVQWIEGNPILDGMYAFDTKEECIELYNLIKKDIHVVNNCTIARVVDGKPYLDELKKEGE